MTNLDALALMKAIDTAWNMRQWDEYAQLLADDLVAWSGSASKSHTRIKHIANAQEFCRRHPSAQVVIDPYIELFASADGKRTCSVASLSGIDGESITFASVCVWRNEQIVQQHEFVLNAR